MEILKVFLLISLLSFRLLADTDLKYTEKFEESISWKEMRIVYKEARSDERTKGMSYLVSGSIGLLGSLLAEANSNDEIERFILNLFQTASVTSIGLGGYPQIYRNLR